MLNKFIAVSLKIKKYKSNKCTQFFLLNLLYKHLFLHNPATGFYHKNVRTF